MRAHSLCISLACYVTLCGASRDVEIERAFGRSELVPQVLETAPWSKAGVSYGPDAIADFGNTLEQEDTERSPDVTWDADPMAYYTLIMIDCDEKSAAIPGGIFLHWLVSNIPGRQVTAGNNHVEYLHPNPPGRLRRQHPHRYIILVYKQSRTKPAFFGESDSRIHFSLASYVKEQNLIGPVAGNFFIVE